MLPKSFLTHVPCLVHTLVNAGLLPCRRWQLLDDGYVFDIQQRPPTPALDMLTSYLEVKYADVLLRKDAVQTTQRQIALFSLQNGSDGYSYGGCNGSSSRMASELLEQPPAALTAAKTLSPAERQAITQTLDDLLDGRQYGRYREAVLQLYCDGLVSWGELQECWAAAQAGEELSAAEEGPVDNIAGEELLWGAGDACFCICCCCCCESSGCCSMIAIMHVAVAAAAFGCCPYR